MSRGARASSAGLTAQAPPSICIPRPPFLSPSLPLHCWPHIPANRFHAPVVSAVRHADAAAWLVREGADATPAVAAGRISRWVHRRVLEQVCGVCGWVHRRVLEQVCGVCGWVHRRVLVQVCMRCVGGGCWDERGGGVGVVMLKLAWEFVRGCVPPAPPPPTPQKTTSK